MSPRKRLNREPFAPLLYLVATERDATLQGLATAIAELLDASNRVCMKLEQERMLVAGARTAWIAEATEELDEAVRDFQSAERTFRHYLAEAARVLAAAPESTLREVAAAAEEPWGFLFEEGSAELRRIFAQLEADKTGLRELLTRSYLAASAALEVLGVPTPNAYDAYGGPAAAATPSVILNTRI